MDNSNGPEPRATRVPNYPSNSLRGNSDKKREDLKIEAVVTGKIVKQKKPIGRKIMETLTGSDVKSVINYVIFDVALPSAKDMIYDMSKEGVHRLLFGDVPQRNSYGRSGRNIQRVSYDRPSWDSRRHDDRPPMPNPREMSNRARSRFEFEEIVLESRGEAENVLAGLEDLISQFDSATVSDLYELIGITSDYTDNKYGWTSIRDAHATKVREGYLLILPRPQLLD